MPKSLEDLENEMRILKNEVQQALLDIREFLLTYVENPFPTGLGRERPPGSGVLSTLSQGANGASAEEKGMGASPSVGGTGAAPPQGIGGAGGPVTVSVGGATAYGGDAASESKGSQGGAPQSADATDRAPHTPLAGKGAPAPPGQRENRPGERQETGAQGPEDTRAAPAQEANGERPPSIGNDLATVALLAPWVEAGLKRVGKQALERVFALYVDLGGVSPGVQKAMSHLLALSGEGEETPSAQPTLRQCLRLLADLDALLLRARRDLTSAVLLSAFLSDGALLGAQPGDGAV
ncbi:hypothetical protein HRbin23_00062 [bacterium HR23]|nr:hypothetical protein HRbin23_00062 [bacterium HR23]